MRGLLVIQSSYTQVTCVVAQRSCVHYIGIETSPILRQPGNLRESNEWIRRLIVPIPRSTRPSSRAVLLKELKKAQGKLLPELRCVSCR